MKSKIIAICIILVLSACMPASTLTPKPTLQVLPKSRRPNIIFILADDMEAAALDFMPLTMELIGKRGAQFNYFYVNNSLCCPSRATILRGQYMHNTQIAGNKLPSGGFDKFHDLGLEANTFPVWLQQAGYNTALFGKYLNEYPGSSPQTYIPPGWTEWYVPAAGNPYRNFNYTLNENGTLVSYGQNPEDYATDVISRKTQDFITQNVESGTPFFAFVSVFAPHTPSVPAPRHEGMYQMLELPRSPSFDEADISDKSQSFNELDPFSEKEIRKMEDLYRKRAESLQAVDELVQAVVTQIENLGQAENTYIIFTSDNGYHMGQHRLVQGKNTAFEEDILVPFIIRGPGISPGTIIDVLAGNVDLAPTFADMAGVVPPDFVDGRSLLPILNNNETDSWRSVYLIERGRGDPEAAYRDIAINSRRIDPGLLEPFDALGKPNYTWPFASPYAGIRTPTHCYLEFEIGDDELYDMVKDPYQLDNLARNADPMLMEYFHNWLASLRTCVGEACRTHEIAP